MSIASPTPAQPAAGLTAVPLFHAAWLFAAGIALAGRLWLQPSVVRWPRCGFSSARGAKKWSLTRLQHLRWRRFLTVCCAPSKAP
jgi:hypothetical protein